MERLSERLETHIDTMASMALFLEGGGLQRFLKEGGVGGDDGGREVNAEDSE